GDREVPGEAAGLPDPAQRSHPAILREELRLTRECRHSCIVDAAGSPALRPACVSAASRPHILGSNEVSVSRQHDEVPAAALPAAPSACPFCQSAKISTPSEKVDASTYWRCDACGQMWNVARLR